MANEAVIVELLGDGGDPIDFTVADATGIEKGTLMSGADARTAISGVAPVNGFVGIAAAEKVASDGQTRLACYTKGIFDLVTDTAVNAGDWVCISGLNCVSGVALEGKPPFVVGRALENGSIDERIEVAVGVY